jgi:hypothetical protein
VSDTINEAQRSLEVRRPQVVADLEARSLEVRRPQVVADLEAHRDAWDGWEATDDEASTGHWPLLQILAKPGRMAQLTEIASGWGADTIQWLEGVDPSEFLWDAERAGPDRDVLVVQWDCGQPGVAG